MAPWDMSNVVAKLIESGRRGVLLTERGTTSATGGWSTTFADSSDAGDRSPGGL